MRPEFDPILTIAPDLRSAIRLAKARQLQKRAFTLTFMTSRHSASGITSLPSHCRSIVSFVRPSTASSHCVWQRTGFPSWRRCWATERIRHSRGLGGLKLFSVSSHGSPLPYGSTASRSPDGNSKCRRRNTFPSSGNYPSIPSADSLGGDRNAYCLYQKLFIKKLYYTL